MWDAGAGGCCDVELIRELMKMGLVTVHGIGIGRGRVMVGPTCDRGGVAVVRVLQHNNCGFYNNCTPKRCLHISVHFQTNGLENNRFT
jgi:hypothetical protein